MDLQTVLYNRDWTPKLTASGLQLGVTSYSNHVRGGPEQASIACMGNELALWETVEWLRCPVELYNDRGECVWWGLVNEVEIQVGAITVQVSLDTMSNKVAVAYAATVAGQAAAGNRATTAWSSNTDSVGAYGTKEYLGSLAAGTAAMADGLRDRLLAMNRYPIPSLSVANGSNLSATLRCVGWWQTLNWRYYNKLAGIEEHTSGTAGQQTLGATEITAVAQSFTLATGMLVGSVALRIKLFGAPTDSLRVRLMSGGGEYPITILATAALVAGTSLSDGYSWVEFTFAPYSLSAGSYWILIERTGPSDNLNAYYLETDIAGGYADGVGKCWESSVWVALNQGGDLLFKVGGVRQTTDQISDIETDVGEFLTGMQIETVSGIYTSPYRDGDGRALLELEQLLDAGTSGGSRLLAMVMQNRKLRVYTEPTVGGNDDYYLDSEGRLWNKWGALVAVERCPAGFWLRLKDVIPATANISRLADPSLAFVERAEYDVAAHRLTMETRGASSPWDLVNVE